MPLVAPMPSPSGTRGSSTGSDPLARLRALPNAPAPNDDIRRIRGNCGSESKQMVVNALAHIAVGGPKGWGNEHTRRLKLVEANLRRRPYADANGTRSEGMEAECVWEIDVREGTAAMLLRYQDANRWTR